MSIQDIQGELALFSNKPDEAYITGPLFAKLLDVSRASFYRHQAAGKLPRGRKVGFNTRYVVGEVREYLADPEKWVAEHYEG